MYPISDLFARRIRQSGRRVTEVDVIYDYLPVPGAQNLPVSSGTLNVDVNSAIRRSGTLVIGDPGLVPAFDTDVLSSLGSEVVIRQGLHFPDGSKEMVPLGVFPIEDVSWDYSNGAVPTVQFYDRSKNYERAELSHPVSFSGMSALQAIVKIAQRVMKLVEVEIGPDLTDYIIPGGVIHDNGNYWDVITKLAANCGGVAYFDVNGMMQIQKRRFMSSSTTKSEAVWQFDAGEGGVLVAAKRTVSRKNVYNFIDVYGAAQPNGVIPWAGEGVNDPQSPIRDGGAFPRAGKPVKDSSLTTDSQCHIRLQYELQRASRPTHSLDMTAVPNPALMEDDLVLARFPDGKEEVHQLNSLSIPLGEGSFTASSINTIAGEPAEGPPPPVPPPLPHAPVIEYVSRTRGSITVRWNDVDNAVSYQVVRGPAPYAFYNVNDRTEMEWKGLRPNTTYTFSVKGVNEVNKLGPTSNVITASTAP